MKRNVPPTPAYNRTTAHTEEITNAAILQWQEHIKDLEKLKQEKIAEVCCTLAETQNTLGRATQAHTKQLAILEKFTPSENRDWKSKLISYQQRLIEINRSTNIVANKVKLVTLKNEINNDISVTADPEVKKSLSVLQTITEYFKMTNNAADIWRIEEIEELELIKTITTSIDDKIKDATEKIEKLRNPQLQEPAPSNFQGKLPKKI